MANNTWKNYTQKSTALSDNDEVMLLDSTDNKNKRGLMSKFWDYVVDKMATAVISKLETDNKTIIGAINALNGNPLSILTRSANSLEWKFDYDKLKTTGAYYLIGSEPLISNNRPNDSCTNCYLLVLARTDKRVTQIVFPGNYPYISYRSLNTDSDTWNEWKTIK